MVFGRRAPEKKKMGGGGVTTVTSVTLKLACAGLPSAGKSTMVNALAGVRLLETGVCRTTSAPCVISDVHYSPGLDCEWKHADNLRSDDGVSLCIVDLPGVADAENTGKESNFTELTQKMAAWCDVIVWVTDVRTCFLTTHEKLEYEKLKAALKVVADREGRLFQFCIVMTKCDVDVDATRVAQGAQTPKQKLKPGEIVSEYEDTTVLDCLARAKRMFPDDRMLPFNAFGRILSRADSSDALRALANRLAPGAGKLNIDFKMKWATEDIYEKRQGQLLSSLLWHMKSSLKAQLSLGRWLASPDLKRRLDEMAPMLEADATAALVCHLLCIEPRVNSWHPAIRGAVAENSSSGTVDRKYLYAAAGIIGVLPRAAAVATKYEYEIFASFDGMSPGAKAELVTAMIQMCGPSCLVTTRMYLYLPFYNMTSAHTVDQTPPSFPMAPRAMSAVPSGYPALFELDAEYNKNRAISARRSWVEKVRAARVLLWSAEDERDVSVETVIELARAGTNILCSVLAPIAGM